MEKAHFKEKIDAMVPDLVAGLTKDCMRLFECGGIDTSKYENNYFLPKIIFTVALFNQTFQYQPFTKEGKAEVNNLKHF